MEHKPPAQDPAIAPAAEFTTFNVVNSEENLDRINPHSLPIGSNEAKDASDSVPKSAIVEWLAGVDADIAEEVAELELKQPDIFASEEDEIAHIIRVAEVLGKRKLLDLIAERLQASETPEN